MLELLDTLWKALILTVIGLAVLALGDIASNTEPKINIVTKHVEKTPYEK